jgi:TetR/AcrR family transcriptional regulator, transcriptional repressor of aconitase
MPRVSQDYLDAQRAELLDGARRCFAAYGYEEATVVRLEEATGRSRGAIFHHFPTKLDLFLAVLERDAEREAARWEVGSVADVLTDLAAEDPDWATVVIEQSRRRRTDPTFRDRWSRRTDLVRDALRALVGRERAAGRVAPAIPDEVAARFISVVGDGLLLQQAILGEVPHARSVIALATTALANGTGHASPPPAGTGHASPPARRHRAPGGGA